MITADLYPALTTLYRYDLGRNARRAAEAKALESAERAYYYAKEVIKGYWPEAEPVMMTDPGLAFRYAKYVIKGRWPEAEAAIMTDPGAASSYALHLSALCPSPSAS